MHPPHTTPRPPLARWRAGKANGEVTDLDGLCGAHHRGAPGSPLHGLAHACHKNTNRGVPLPMRQYRCKHVLNRQSNRFSTNAVSFLSSPLLTGPPGGVESMTHDRKDPLNLPTTYTLHRYSTVTPSSLLTVPPGRVESAHDGEDPADVVIVGRLAAAVARPGRARRPPLPHPVHRAQQVLGLLEL
jgi:hypothetical protein